MAGSSPHAERRLDAARCPLALSPIWACSRLPRPRTPPIAERVHDTADPIPCAVQATGSGCASQTFVVQPRRTPAQHREDLRRRADRRAASRSRPRRAGGPDGPYPLVMLFHGYGGAKAARWPACSRGSTRGYATLSMTPARLRRVLRHAGRARRGPGRLRARVRAPCRHPLRGPRRAGAGRPAG